MQLPWDHDRNLWATTAKPQGVYRVLCLGDSMIYGSGVNLEETLPAQLEVALNGAAWGVDVEVINAGVSGESAYDAWHRFCHLQPPCAPDVVALLLCGNDAELFSVNTLRAQGQEISYTEHTAACWRPEGLHYRHLSALLAEIAAWRGPTRPPLLLGFYEIHDSPIRAEASGRLAARCAALGLPFVDLSSDFIGPTSSQQVEGLAVSVVDGHPSGQAHGIAARRLARALLKLGAPPRGLDLDEQAALEGLLISHQARLDLGYRPEYVVWRLRRMMEIKRASRARLKLSEAARLSEAAWRPYLEAVGGLEASIFAALRWPARAAEVHAQAAALHAATARVDLDSKGLWRSLMTLRHAAAAPELPLISFHPGDPERIDLAALETLTLEIDAWRARRAQIIAALSADDAALRAQPLETFIMGPQRQLIEAVAALEGHLERLGAALEGAMAMIKAVVSALETAPPSRVARAAISGIIEGLLRLRGPLGVLAEGLTAPPPPPPSAPYTRVEVIARVAGPPVALWVQARPDAAPWRSDMRWAIGDGQPHVYRFEAPLLWRGVLQAELMGEGVIEALRVEGGLSEALAEGGWRVTW
ncbi:hypothetical protein KKB55_22885 [Myxococcota bacterium]|nr:hypothetical protein [Myxococcota bacterium]MBU1900602.1 hypothetical protein [Myxococcota bacterium]